MSLPPTYARVITGLAVLAVILAVLLIGDLGGDDSPDAGTEPSPTLTPTSPPPTSVSAEDFCVAFNAMAAAQANHVANDTDASLAELRAKSTQLLWLAPGTPMGPAARQGLQELVDGAVGDAATPPDQAAADALSAYLEVSCRPGGL